MGNMYSPGDRSRRQHQLKQQPSIDSRPIETEPPSHKHQKNAYGAQSANKVLSALQAPIFFTSLFRRAPQPKTAQVATPESKHASQPVENTEHLTLVPYRDQIMRALHLSSAVVISAPTSSGKTTWLPRTVEKELSNIFPAGSLPDNARPQVVCSVPRVIQTVQIAKYVSQLEGCELGEKIGFRNSRASRYSDDTAIVYETHGYLLQRLLNQGIPAGSIVMIDEAHENQADLPPLLCLLRQQIDQGNQIKVILMSATINATEFSSYFGGAPTIQAQERHRKVNITTPNDSLESDIIDAINRGETPLVFLPGKREIQDLTEKLAHSDPTINCIPLHAQLPLRTQQLAFNNHEPGSRTAVLSTNVGGTGLTYPKAINTVIVTNEVKSMTVLNGIQTLAYRTITKSEVAQCMGRVGRIDADGTAILRLNPNEQLRPHMPPEIQNVPLETMMLRFIAARLDLSRLNINFIHKASESQLKDAQRTLYHLDLIGPQGHITDTGKIAAKFPVEVHMGKVLAKAYALRSEYPGVLLAAIDIAAITESQGILTDDARLWQRLRSSNTNSDTIAHMEVFQNALSMKLKPGELADFGIREVNFMRALDTRNSLRSRLRIDTDPSMEEKLSPEEMLELRRCIWSGMIDSLYRFSHKDAINGDRYYKGLAGQGTRMLSKDSIVNDASYIVGSALNLEVKRASGIKSTLELILMATAVDKKWLENNVPPQMPEVREAVNSEPASHRKTNFHRTPSYRRQ